jgi:lipopolysaccharide biosynthesis regulator YciM
LSNQSSSKVKTKQIEFLLKDFKEGAQKQRALLLLADEYFNDGSYDKAIEIYQNVLNESRSSLHQQLANVGIAYSLEGKKDYKNAINAYKKTIQHSNEYPLFDVYVSLSRCYIENDEINEALLILREMQSKFPSNPKINTIDNKIKELGV